MLPKIRYYLISIYLSCYKYSVYKDKMIKGLFLVILLLAVASTKAAVDEKGEKK